MAMCRSGLLLHLNAKSSSCVVRKPKMVRAIGWMCLLLRALLGRKNAKDNAIMLPATLKVTAHGSTDERRYAYMNPDRIRIIKLHKRWADGWTLLWQIFTLLLFGGIYIGLEQFGVGAAERSSAFILLGVMVLVAAIWQSTGLGVARVHMLFSGIDLEQPPKERKSNADGLGK